MKKLFLLLMVAEALMVSCNKSDSDTEPNQGTGTDSTTDTTVHNGGMSTDETFTVNDVSFTMKPVEGGTFWMGSQNTDPNEQNYDADAYDYYESPVHQVTLSSYSIGETEVTQDLWQAVMGNNPSGFTGDLQRPVEQVSWNDIVDNFLPKLNAMLASRLGGRHFALPTEAQWEYAARGGNQSHGYQYSGSNDLSDVGWYGYENDGSTSGNSDNQTHPVKGKAANELGLYDMSGNVREWCNDWFGNYNTDAQTNPTGPITGSDCVLRGGSWFHFALHCRVSNRNYSYPPSIRSSSLGFRLVLLP